MAATVSASVDLIVKAFVDGLSVLSRIHEGRGNKKKKKHSAHNEQPARDVGRSLSKSLRRGHTDVQQEYERSLLSVGEQFAIGDETAQGSLLRVILKLNSGLVGIIHSFLDKKRPGQQLDYSALTNISDSTRRDAVGTLQQLSRRISMSHQHLQLPPHSPEYNVRRLRTPTADERRLQGPGHQHCWRRCVFYSALSTAPPSPSRNLSDFSSPPASRVEDAYVGACVEPRGSAGDPKNLRGEEGVATLSRRRRALPTPTFYSVASTGTKLGEIPMHKWAVPFDFEEMERLNLEAEINGWPLPVDPQGKKPRFGFLKMFKKKGAETS
ncbi:hypothetical protein H2203_007527 [Taxawa tesnikishii (nom. ined.)]|nr:hypothetical protein H2203_007527 [Dothideales sp. JES 119]